MHSPDFKVMKTGTSQNAFNENMVGALILSTNDSYLALMNNWNGQSVVGVCLTAESTMTITRKVLEGRQ